MINRYSSRKIFVNEEEMYSSILDRRNVKSISHYETPTYYNPSVEEYGKINFVEHIWTTGDRYYKLASQYYGDPRDWWIIAKFNNKPTESHNNIGDIIYIPTKIEEVKRLFKF